MIPTISRWKILILVGFSSIVLGVLLLGWDPSAAGDMAGMLLLFPGMLILLADHRLATRSNLLNIPSNLPAGKSESRTDGLYR